MKKFLRKSVSVIISLATVFATLLSSPFAFAEFETPEIPISCDHIYVWKYDANYHWKQCKKCNEKLAGTTVAHVYDNASDKTCNVCGYTRTVHVHSYSSTWSYDSTQHWHACSCGAKKDVANHSAGDWVITKEATATQTGTRVQKCKVCSAVLKTETIPALGNKLAAPANLSVTAKSRWSVNVTFSKVTGADGYEIYNKTTGKTYYTTDNSYTVKWLKSGKVYEFYVKAYSGSGNEKVYGTQSKAYKAATKPGFTFLTLKSGEKQFTASCKKVSGATGYEFTYSLNKSFSDAKTVSADSVSTVVSKLETGKKYYVKVRAFVKTDSATVYGSYSFTKSVTVS